ncbi:PrsW family intramembrane metalloprotease [Gaetbulibacter saemankumensis]|uniref:PrsW family intramembrane metalloprotease n=1 Tax=Gaetbulibacter saemankumensis TaxID=311208 RepID=UPI000411CAA1|nr:PrsW family glutamic-type intramembrane protease [Gaetbulibacter saemankumensis]
MNLILLSIVPIVIVVLYIYHQDKHEKEPKRFLFYNFLLGAIVSIFITTVLYFCFDYVLPITEHTNIVQQFLKAFLVVGFTEEFSKYIIIKYYAQTNQEFNEPFDGIVYAVMVSMGFAATENFFYVLQGGYEAALLRAFTAIPAHASFGILMGYYMGKAKFSNKRILLNFIGLLLAILFHGIYDFFLFIDFVPGIWVGAFISLGIALILSHKAIIKHQENSNFKV